VLNTYCVVTCFVFLRRKKYFTVLVYSLTGVADHIKIRAIVFHAMMSDDLVSNIGHTVVFDHVITNIGKAYNPHTGHFTVPYDGLYFFTVSVSLYDQPRQ
jgi:hypothetical protein